MKGFLVALGGLLLSTFACGGSFLAGNVGLALPALLGFYLMSIVAAYYAGRSVDLQSPIRPRDQPREYRRNVPIERKESLLNRAKQRAAAAPADEFN
jgi:hypothetical protein